MFDFIDIKTFYVIIHLFGVIFGAGGAYISDLIFFKSIKDKKISQSEFGFMKLGSNAVWFGLFILLVSGTLIFSLDPATYMESSKFISKMAIVAIIALNGVIFHIWHIPFLKKIVNKSKGYQERGAILAASGAISLVSWTLVTVLGALRMVPFTVTQVLLAYFLITGIAVIGAVVTMKRL